MKTPTKEIRAYMKRIGTKGGSQKSPEKRAALIVNLKKARSVLAEKRAKAAA